ncbi:MAG: DJ-1/PfpI family protein [Candidatus Onthovivens sp.]|nr:DJ-1/PfpI family protein [Candidatus Onthovivens sp.]
MKKVICILTNGFEEIEALGTIAILRRAKIDVDIFSLNTDEATGRYNIHVTNLGKFSDINLENYDCLFIAGGPEYVELESSEKFKKVILHFASQNRTIAAICAGPTILGHLGLLKGLNYTCFNSMNEDFGGTYIDKYVVEDKNIITGKSAAATIDFAFKIVESLTSKEHAEKVKNSIYYYNN